MLATLFYNPIELPFKTVLWYIIPLCLAVSIIYKTIRAEKVSQIPKQVAFLMVYMTAGLLGVGLVLWLIHTYWPVG